MILLWYRMHTGDYVPGGSYVDWQSLLAIVPTDLLREKWVIRHARYFFGDHHDRYITVTIHVSLS
jgi:hypothetical protein